MSGAAKKYESLSKMVCGIGSEERYKEGRRGDDIEVDAMGQDLELNVERYYEEPAAEPQYSEQQWSDWTTTREATLEEARNQIKELETEVDWLGKGGSKCAEG